MGHWNLPFLQTKQEHRERVNGANGYLKLKLHRRYKWRTIRTISPARVNQVNRAGNRKRVKADHPIRVVNRAVAAPGTVNKAAVSKLANKAVNGVDSRGV